MLAYPISAWVIGIIIERHSDANAQKALADAPYLAIAKREYHRGIFSSTVQTTYHLSLPVAKAAFVKNSLDSWQLTVRSVIHHGPLPGLRTVALATVDSDLELPAQVSQSVKAVLGGRSPLEAHGRIGWFGGATTSFTSPAFTLKLENGATVNWRGISGTGTSSDGLATWSGNAAAPGLTVDYGATHAEVGTVSFTADMRRIYDTLNIGKVSLKVAGATVHSGELDRDLTLKGLTLGMVSSQSGDYVDSAVELIADVLETKQFSASQIGYAVSFNHVHGPSLAALTTAIRQGQREALGADKEAWQAKLRDSFRDHGIDVLLHEPVIEIPRIGFVMPEGEMRLSAKLSAPGLKREDLQGPALAAAILQHLKARADLSVDVALLDKLLPSNQNRAALQQQLDTLQRQGYVQRAGTQYRVHIEYERGKTVVNGQSFPPVRPQ